MDAVKLTIRATEEYHERINKARESENLRKCRSWIDLLEPADENAEVQINGNGIILKCNTRKGSAQDSCTYDGVLAVTEMRDGVLLRLSHKRLLWLPVSEDAQENELLMEAMLLLCTHCRYLFRTARLELKGIGLAKKIAFHTRLRQGYDTGGSFVKGSLILLICFSLLVATIFAGEPFRNRKIEEQDAIALSAVFDRADAAYGKSSVKYMDLQFRDADEQTVDGCCLGYGLQEKLEQLPSGTRMHLLIHPVSGSVLQIQTAGETLLDFDNAQNRLWNEAMAFMWLGLFLYAVSICLAVGMIRKKL